MHFVAWRAQLFEMIGDYLIMDDFKRPSFGSSIPVVIFVSDWETSSTSFMSGIDCKIMNLLTEERENPNGDNMSVWSEIERCRADMISEVQAVYLRYWIGWKYNGFLENTKLMF